MTLPQLPVRPSPPRFQVVAAFAAIYLIWGSTLQILTWPRRPIA